MKYFDKSTRTIVDVGLIMTKDGRLIEPNPDKLHHNFQPIECSHCRDSHNKLVYHGDILSIPTGIFTESNIPMQGIWTIYYTQPNPGSCFEWRLINNDNNKNYPLAAMSNYGTIIGNIYQPQQNFLVNAHQLGYEIDVDNLIIYTNKSIDIHLHRELSTLFDTEFGISFPSPTTRYSDTNIQISNGWKFMRSR